MKRLYGIVFFYFFSTCSLLYSQDVHFSQFDASPLILNPANTGNFTGFFRFSANYRNQWQVLNFPYRSSSVSYDRHLLKDFHQLGVGITLLNDNSGEARINFNKAYISLAGHFGQPNSRFSIGVQPGFVQKSFNLSGLSFPVQYDPKIGVHNATQPNREVMLNQNVKYFDFNVGASWVKRESNAIFKIGTAVYHITKPNESFLGTNFEVPVRFVIHSSFTRQIGENLSLIPKLFYMRQATASELLLGSYLGMRVPPNPSQLESVFFGLLSRTGVGRNTDAFIAVIGGSFSRWDIGISYDVNSSSLSKSTNLRGGFELSAVFWSGETQYKHKTVLCERL